jgi:hypothetical protein
VSRGQSGLIRRGVDLAREARICAGRNSSLDSDAWATKIKGAPFGPGHSAWAEPPAVASSHLLSRPPALARLLDAW